MPPKNTPEQNGYQETGESPEKKEYIEIRDTPGQQKVKGETRPQLTENLTTEQKDIINDLKKAQTIEQRVTLISKRLDKYGIEAIASFIPAIGDTAMAIITTSYLIIEGYTIGLSLKDCLKILGYQILDAAIGSIPLAGDLVDFLFKSNKYSAKIFSKHLEKLKKAAKEKGISQEQIDNIGKRETKFIKAMDKYTKY